ncbi:MAG: hypothetical protein P4M01_08920 [Acidobacteriota bacterium]|nr:hypothetical protein [Acidobacteriota bacterium]
MQLDSTPQADHVTANGLTAASILHPAAQAGAEPHIFEPQPPSGADMNSIRFARGLLVAIPAAAIVWIMLGGLVWLMFR